MELQRQLAEALDPEEQQRLNEQLFEKQQAFDEWKYQQQLKDKKESIRAQMDEVRAQAEQEIASKESEYEQEKSLLEANQQAMIEAIQKGQEEMVAAIQKGQTEASTAIQEGGEKSLNIQDANAMLAMGINKSLTEDKQENLDKQYEAVIDNENKSAQAVEDACVEMYRKNYKMGVQMVNGIADGVLNQTWRAVKAIGMMCDKMIQEAQNRLDIHSPSRVFRKMGEYVDQGFGNGIDDGSDDVVSSMSTMCKKLTSAVNVDDLVGKMSAAVNGEIAITSSKLTGSTSNNTTNSTVTNNNTSNTPITINNYNVDKDERNVGRELGNQVARRLRGRGITSC